MNFKTLRSKTFLVGLGFVAMGVFQISQGDSSTGMQNLLVGFGIITGRDAIQKLLP